MVNELEVYNQPTNEEIEIALKGDIKRLWELIATLRGNGEFNKRKAKAKNGINLLFNIEYVIRGYVEEYPDSHKVKIKGYRKTKLDKYWEEIRAREMEMKDLLREIYDGGNQEEWERDKKD